MHTCNGCGEKYHGDNHHCDPKREDRIEATRKAHEQVGILRQPTFSERLAIGFAMLGGVSVGF